MTSVMSDDDRADDRGVDEPVRVARVGEEELTCSVVADSQNFHCTGL